MADKSQLLKDIEAEILGEKTALIKKSIESVLDSYRFDEKNISPKLMALLMATKQQIKVPLPEQNDIPEDVQDEAAGYADILNANVSGIYTDLIVGNNVYLYGKAGTGKTTLAKKIASNFLRRQSYVINCNQFTSPIDIIGGQTIEGYKQGKLVNAWREGGCLILDELPKLDPNTAGLLNEALAQSADKPEILKIGEKEFEEKLSLMANSDTELGFRVYANMKDLIKDYPERKEQIEKSGEGFFKVNLITITDGSGERIIKHPNFCVIATGNTNMKEISSNFSGNNRQDYSLVDRFAGSFYEIGYDDDLEYSLTYNLVYRCCIKVREILNADLNSVESVSLRTMLNFNRIFEQEYLRKIESPYAKKVIKISGNEIGKTFEESLRSFIETLPETKQKEIMNTNVLHDAAVGYADHSEFIEEFKRIHDGIDPKAGEASE